jgi:hypothetical protein
MRVPTAEVAPDSAEEDALVIVGWERRGEEEEDPDYEARVDCPPTPIVAAYTRINSHEADGEFVPSPSPKSPPTISQSVRTALERAIFFNSALKSRKIVNISCQTLMTNDVGVPLVEVLQHPWVCVRPSIFVAAKVGISNLHLCYTHH